VQLPRDCAGRIVVLSAVCVPKEPDMKNRSMLIAVVLAAPGLLAAQSWQPAPSDAASASSITIITNDGKTVSTTTVAVVPHPACPVAMQAKQGSGEGLVMVKKSQPDAESNGQKPSFRPAGHIRLIVSRMPGGNLDFEQVERATITARGLSARSRIDRTPASMGGTTPDLHRTFDVTFSADNDGTLYADLDLPGFTSVQSIRIDKLALKDGSIWTLDSKQGCVAVPDPLMLIAGR
jgi:hypothetical protein